MVFSKIIFYLLLDGCNVSSMSRSGAAALFPVMLQMCSPRGLRIFWAAPKCLQMPRKKFRPMVEPGSNSSDASTAACQRLEIQSTMSICTCKYYALGTYYVIHILHDIFQSAFSMRVHALGTACPRPSMLSTWHSAAAADCSGAGRENL